MKFKRWTISLAEDRALEVLAPNSCYADNAMRELMEAAGMDAYGCVTDSTDIWQGPED